MRSIKQLLRSKLNPFIAAFMVILTTFGAVPLNVFASEGLPIDPKLAMEAKPFIARINGKKVRVATDGTAMVNVRGRSKPVKMEVPRYIYLDGEAIPVDDDRIENITPVLASAAPSSAFSMAPFSAFTMATAVDTPSIGFIATLSGAIPDNPIVGTVGQEYVHPAYVTMNSRIVSSRRYVVSINGVDYEAFCADPNRPGPETNASVYELTGVDGSKFSTVLKYGYPANPALSNDTLTNDERAWNAYITRVAVAYISKPGATWGNLTGTTEVAVNNRISGMGGATAIANSPAITVNGKSVYSGNGIDSQSSTFALGNNRRTNCWRNPFRFEWADDTPAGTKLYVDGSHVATAPINPTNIYSVHTGGGFTSASSLHFEMPAGSEGKTASVNLVGINNQYADRVFVMQNPNDVDGWQDIVFYVPEALAKAEYTWDYEPDDGSDGRLRIIKRNQQTSQGLAGATFHISGPSGFSTTRTTPANGIILLGDLEPGSYTITETNPPDGYYLSSPVTQTASVTAGQQAAVEVVFSNQPINGNMTSDIPAPVCYMQTEHNLKIFLNILGTVR